MSRPRLHWNTLDRLLILLLPVGIMGFFALSGYRAAGPSGSSNSFQGLQEMLEPILKLPSWALIGLIFLNNAFKGLLVIVLGLGVGLFPVLFLAVNGLVIGVVVGNAVAQFGGWVTFMALAPHGVLELPAILLASGLGLRLGAEVTLQITGRPTRVRRWLTGALGTYLRIILPTLLMAAVLEVLVTPRVSQLSP